MIRQEKYLSQPDAKKKAISSAERLLYLIAIEQSEIDTEFRNGRTVVLRRYVFPNSSSNGWTAQWLSENDSLQFQLTILRKRQKCSIYNSCFNRNFCHLQLYKDKVMEAEFIISRKC